MRSHARRRRYGALALPFGAVLVALLVPLAIFLGTTWLQGRTLHLVRSGSMTPAYPVGSVLVVEPVEPADVHVGSTIAFVDPMAPGRLVSHRVVEVGHHDQEPFFRVKGDANTQEDPFPVAASAVRGRVAWHVVKLGRLLDWLRWPRGFLVLVGVPGLVLIATEAWRWHRTHPAARLDPTA